VFRARDTKLNRDVAIKVLAAAFADDPERLARFTREAQTLASLNHRNIATIYGIEWVASSDLVAMTKGRALPARSCWSWSRARTSPLTSLAYDIHPDGKRLAIIAAAEENGVVQDKVVFFFGFGDYLKKIAPVTKP
jgi:serine/threonine protein kinase